MKEERKDIVQGDKDYDKYGELWNALIGCRHIIKAQRSGGIRCIKCGGWCCY